MQQFVEELKEMILMLPFQLLRSPLFKILFLGVLSVSSFPIVAFALIGLSLSSLLILPLLGAFAWICLISRVLGLCSFPFRKAMLNNGTIPMMTASMEEFNSKESACYDDKNYENDHVAVSSLKDQQESIEIDPQELPSPYESDQEEEKVEYNDETDMKVLRERFGIDQENSWDPEETDGWFLQTLAFWKNKEREEVLPENDIP